MSKVEITFSYYFKDSDLREFKNLKIGNYKIQAQKSLKPDPHTGGLIWYGIVIFLASGIASGFLQELGKDIHNFFKDKLFKKKQKLQKSNIEKFTINIVVKNSMLFVNLTNLNEREFKDGLNRLSKDFKQLEPKISQNEGWYDFTFNKKTKCWELNSRNLI